MKTVLIETVYNGWIVRPAYQTCNNCAPEATEVRVYNHIEDLVATLPEIMDIPPAHNLLVETLPAQ